MTAYRPATEADRPLIAAFLDTCLPIAMFPAANLARHGMAGDHPHVTQFWIAQKDAHHASAPLTGVIGITRRGVLLPVQGPDDDALAALALAGQPIRAVVGTAPRARGLIAAAGLKEVPTTLDKDEPHFSLTLTDLRIPVGPGTLIPLADAPQDLMRAWFIAFQRELLTDDPATAQKQGQFAHDEALAANTAVVLMVRGAPVAMTGTNARLPKIVQVGGVYCPPDLGGQGHARRAVALHLAMLRDSGVQQAVLFAATPSACRAYEAIGFQRIGDWTLTLFKGPVRIGG